jgi:hypothetical protein
LRSTGVAPSARPSRSIRSRPCAPAPIDLLIDAEAWEQILDALPHVPETNEGSTYLHYGKHQADFTFFDDEFVQMKFSTQR